MNNDYEDSEEYKKMLEITKKQEKLYENVRKVYTEISPETLARFNEINKRLNQWKSSISNLPGFQKMTEVLKNYEKEVRENENLSETEFEEKYKKQISLSKKLGRNGWVITQYTNPAGIEQWKELLDEGKAGIQVLFDGDDFPILVNIEEELRKKYVTGAAQKYFSKGMEAFENNDYMSSAMYLLGLLDYRMSQLVEFPDRYMKNKEKYSDVGFANQKTGDFNQFTQNKRYISKKIFFLEMYPSLIEYLNRVFYDEPYPFVKGIEPPYLNRNWLMHGRMTREIERYECIQVLNALSVVEFMFGKDESDN